MGMESVLQSIKNAEESANAKIAASKEEAAKILADARKEASEIMVGTNLNDEVLDKVSKLCMDSCNPIDDKRGTVEYRTKVAGVLFKRTTLIAIDRIKGK